MSAPDEADVPVRVMLDDEGGESVQVRTAGTPAPAPSPSREAPDPPSQPRRDDSAQADWHQPEPPVAPDPSLAVLGNPEKSRPIASDGERHTYVPLEPSLVTPAPEPAPTPPDFDAAPPREHTFTFDDSNLPMPGDAEFDWSQFGSHSAGPEPSEPAPRVHLPDPEAEARALEKERNELLAKLDYLEKHAHVKLPKRYTHTSSIDELRSTYARYYRMRQMESGLEFSHKLLIGFTGLVEWANHQFDPIGARLDGWSTSVMANIDQFDHTLLKVWEKYAHVIGEFNPLIELVLALTMSGVMYHFMQVRIQEELAREKERPPKEDADFQEQVRQAAAEMFRKHQSAPDGRSPPPRPPRGPGPAPAVYTNPEKARRDAERDRRRATIERYQQQQQQQQQPGPPGMPIGMPGNPFGLLSSAMQNPSGMLSSMMGNEQVREMMNNMGMGGGGMSVPNFVPPTPAPHSVSSPSEPSLTIPERVPTPVYNPAPPDENAPAPPSPPGAQVVPLPDTPERTKRPRGRPRARRKTVRLEGQ